MWAKTTTALINTKRSDGLVSLNQGRLKANRKDNDMWYFAWVLGLGFAVLLAVLNAMWGEFEEERAQSLPKNRGNAS